MKQRKLGSYEPGALPGISLCATCVSENKRECLVGRQMVKCPDYVRGADTSD